RSLYFHALFTFSSVVNRPRPPIPSLFPYTTLFRSGVRRTPGGGRRARWPPAARAHRRRRWRLPSRRRRLGRTLQSRVGGIPFGQPDRNRLRLRSRAGPVAASGLGVLRRRLWR